MELGSVGLPWQYRMTLETIVGQLEFKLHNDGIFGMHFACSKNINLNL